MWQGIEWEHGQPRSPPESQAQVLRFLQAGASTGQVSQAQGCPSYSRCGLRTSLHQHLLGLVGNTGSRAPEMQSIITVCPG